MTNKFVDPRNSRGTHQDSIYQSIVDAGEDPFAKENLLKYHKGEVLHENDSWYVIYNQWPYPRTKHHFVIILKTSKKHFLELLMTEMDDLRQALRWITVTYNVDGGGFAMRFGDTLLSGSTVTRIHAHLIEPDINHPDYNPEQRVNFVIGGNKTKPETPPHGNKD